MTELDRLRSRLARLTDIPVVGAEGRRVLTGPDGPVSALAMQREIEETQLPRVLAFLNERGEALGLHVKAGRVLAVVDLPGQAEQCSLRGKHLSESDPADTSGVASCLARFLRHTQSVRVHSSLRPPPIDPAAMGLNTAACFAVVASLWQDEQPSGLCDLASRLASLDAAWIRIDGSEIVEHHGDGPRIARLLDFAELEMSAGLFASSDDEPDLADRCVLYCAEGDRSDAVLAGQLNGQTVFVAFRAAEMPSVLAIWTMP